jgi:hypothetical protein
MNDPAGKASSREGELLAQGWSRQFLTSGSRLKDAKESYEAVGLEVHLELAQTKDLACSECQPPQPSATVEGWYVIYTRPKPEGECAAGRDEDLW